jgi:ketosteroid isomerase-like protein
MSRTGAILILAFMILSAIRMRAEQSADTASIPEIRAVLENQSKAWNKGDIDGYMQYYRHSDSLLFTSGGQIRRGRQATIEKYKKSYNSREMMGTLRFTGLEVHLLSGESAWAFGRWELKRKKDHPGGVFTLILRKFSDGWKIIHDHTSSDSPK